MTDDIARQRMGFTDDDGVAVSDVDCTPRPRRGESKASFAKRMAGYARELTALSGEINRRNRTAALQPMVMGSDGIAAYFTQCACGWCGLRVADPELAKREYDAHACAIGNTFRPGRTSQRTGDPLPANWADETKAKLAESAGTPVATVTSADGTETRMALLELK